MEMTRRDWCKYMALLAAGASALPAQIAAYERLYDVNTVQLGETGLVALRDLVIGFRNPCDVSMHIRIFDRSRVLFNFALNKRATFRWVPSPECPKLANGRQVRWQFQASGEENDHHAYDLEATLEYVDQASLIHTVVLSGPEGHLSAA